MGAKNTKPDVKDRLKGSLKKVWPRYPRTVGDPDPISRGSSGSQEVPPTYCQEMYESNERQHDIRCQDVHSKLDSKRYRDKPQLTQGELNDRRHDAVPHTKPNGEQHDQSRRQNQPMDNFSIQSETAPPAKLDLWQRAFYNLTQDKQQLIKSIPMPIYDKLEYDDVNINPDTASRLKALSGVVKAVKIQYEIDQKESRIKEPAQKIVKAVISFQEFIQAAVAFDPTGHATSVWAVVSLGLNVTQNYRSQKVAWLESCAFLTDILTRYSFVEDEYQKDPRTDEHVEAALVQVYVAVLDFAAQVQSLCDRNRAIWIWKSIPGDSLSELQKSVDEAESRLKRWLQIVDRREQREKGDRLLERADKILTKIDHVLGPVNEIHDDTVFKELKVAEEARYNSITKEEYEECLPETRNELLKDIKTWATSPNRQAVFWLQGMAGTGKSTVSRTVARWLDAEGLLGGSFFFRKGGTDRADAKRLFTTLTKQITERLPHLQQPVKRTIRDSRDIGSCLIQEQFNELLWKPLMGLNLGLETPLILVVIIDALDECQVPSHVAAFLSILPKLNDLKDVQLRMFITSRPEPPVMKGFRPIDKDEIILHQIDRSTIERDISIFFRQKLNEINDGSQLPKDWPGDKNLQALVNMSFPLFIYAATIYRFINCDDAVPEDRLQAVLSSHSKKGMAKSDDEYGEHKQLIDIYFPVLEHITSQKQRTELKHWMDDFRRIMGAVVLLFSPLSSVSLAKLICFDEARVKRRLVSLQSVVSVPKDSATPIELLHLSFREFLVDCSASDKFWINEPAGHTQLGRDCLERMNQELKMNICHLSHPGVRKNEIEKATLDTYVPPELRYACRYWIHHLQNGESSTIDWTLVERFLKSHFLHWLEIMSLFGWVSEIFDNIKALEWLQKVNHAGCEIKFEGTNGQTKSYLLADFLYDAKRFILKNRQIVDEAPLQVYGAGLVFAPRTAIIREMFQSEHPKWICQLPQVQENWSAELQVLEGHTASVQSVAFSPDGQLLASGSDDKIIQLWDPATGALQQTLKGHIDWVQSVAFSPDSQQLASCSSDKTVCLWDLATGTPQKMLEGHTDSVQSVAFSPDSQLLASGSSDKTVQLWDPATGTPQKMLEGHAGSVKSVVFSPDGQLLASGSSDKTVQLWDPATGALQQTLKGHTDYIRSVAFSPNGQLLASGSDDKIIQLWDPATGALQQTLKGHTNWVKSMAFSPNGQLLASGSDDKIIQLWDPATGALQQTLKDHTDWGRWVISVTFSPDSQLLASGLSDRIIQLWDPATGALQQTLKGHTDYIRSVAFSPNGQLLASGSDDNTVRLWDPATGDLTEILSTKGCVTELEFSQNGSNLSTNLGSFKIQSSCGNPTPCSSDMGQGVSLQDEWIAVDGNQVLWLPPEARYSCSATRSNTLALGHKSGRISLIGFAK